MEELACTTHQQQSISDLSNSVMEQLTMFLGGNVYEYEHISAANTKLSHSSEKLRMATSHVFSSMRDSLERLQIPNDAPEAFIWMQFTECFIDVDEDVDAKLAFPIASEGTPVCALCSDIGSSRSEGEVLHSCAHSHRSSQGIIWSCCNHFHLSCRDRAQKTLSKQRQRSIEGLLVDKKTMFYCISCLLRANQKKKIFPAAKLQQAAGVSVPPSLTFCEIYGQVPNGDSEYMVTRVKPGVFPFLSFGWHHAEASSANWRSIEYWTTKASVPNDAAAVTDPGSSRGPAASACALVVRDCPHGKMWSFSGEMQTQRCARVGLLTSDALRKCGVKEARMADLVAAEIMQKMRHSLMDCPPNPEKRWEIICVKKIECWTFALARDNGDVVVVTDGKVSLSGSLPDTSNVPPLSTRTLTVKRCDSQPCAAERVAWNCDGTVLAASCHDHRIVTWEKGRDIDAHPVDTIPKRNLKRGTCEWSADGPIVSLSWSPVHPHIMLAASPSSCFVLHFQTATPSRFASISVQSVHNSLSVITCAVFGSNGAYIAVGTQSSGWFVVNTSSDYQSFRSDCILPLGDSAISSVVSICALPVVKPGSDDRDVVTDGRDFAVASRVASHSIVHIWKYSEFKCKFEAVKELRLPSSSDSSSIVTSLICSRDSEKDADSFKILALNGSSIGYLINYLGGYCYDSYIRPVEFWCPMEKKPVNVTRAAWGSMARAIAFCDFSAKKTKELGGFWWGLPRLYELWRGQTDAHKSVSKPWRADHREAFGPALTCDISVHTVVRDGDSVEDADKGDLRMIERVWNHDVAIHQQVVNNLADYWKEFAKSRNISGEVVEKVVQQIAVISTSFIPHHTHNCIPLRLKTFFAHFFKNCFWITLLIMRVEFSFHARCLLCFSVPLHNFASFSFSPRPSCIFGASTHSLSSGLLGIDSWCELFSPSCSCSHMPLTRFMQLRLSFLPDSEAPANPAVGKKHDKRRRFERGKHCPSSDGSCLVPG
jgi:hypothetical protein